MRSARIWQSLTLLIFLLSVTDLNAQENFQRIQGINYAEVVITDSFWSPKIQDVANNAIDVCIYQTETATPRIRNYEKVAARKGERHEGIYYDDSDVYKALEAMAYALHSVPDPDLEKKADEWIDKIAAAQQPDGYLNTYYTLEGLENRWRDMERHEAYCAGHLMEAAVAYYHATGKRKLLDVAIRFADHIDETFRKSNRPWVVGHQEIELALVKLYRVTNNNNYLKLAEYFLDQRGHGHGKGKIWDEWGRPEYCQDEVPVKEQTEITGHAVRAMYMYTGIADIAAISNDQDYMKTMLTIWEDVVHRNTYVTGGIGSSGRNEGFSIDYDLPNEHAYCETCASVGMVFWNQRMNWLTGEAKYMDVLERSLYNSALDGISLDGKQFFYPNPLASHGQHARRDWFGTACCPSNISRLITSLGNYIYGKSQDDLWINLFIGSETEQNINNTPVQVKLTTKYPRGNKINLKLTPKKAIQSRVHLRIPGWAANEAMPGGLYYFTDRSEEQVKILVNGEESEYISEKGYAVLEGLWEGENTIEMILPMRPRILKSREEVEENNNRVALQYGPLVYCFESKDNYGSVWNILFPEDAQFILETGAILDEKVITLTAQLPVLMPGYDRKSVETRARKMTAIPYYTWCNRGNKGMQVWMPVSVSEIELR